jgi:hypothetical protein
VILRPRGAASSAPLLSRQRVCGSRISPIIMMLALWRRKLRQAKGARGSAFCRIVVECSA